MGDSDDDFDNRRNRDKFRREREDFGGRDRFRRTNPSRFSGSPPPNKRIRPDEPPQFLSFKTFLLEQDDNIDQEEAVKLYSLYKINFRKTQLNEFFNAHKEESWFRAKYHPDEFVKRLDEQKQVVEQRRKVFFELYNSGALDNLSVDIEHETELVQFLDSVVSKLETDRDIRTTSIFFRQIPMQTSKAELESLCKSYEGFRRVCLTDPAPERKFLRRGWATFDSDVQIRNICYEFNSTKLHELELSPIVNRELKNRLRPVTGLGPVEDERRLATKLLRVLNDQWESESIDALVLYLRVVHSIDFYNGSEYAQEDSMPNRCGVLHVRGADGVATSAPEERVKALFEAHERPSEEGARNEDEEIEKFMNANCQEIGKEKWVCPLSGKKFKGPEFVRKHILNKHQDKLDEVKKEVAFFNNYFNDPKRPEAATPSKPVVNQTGLPLPTPQPPPLINRPPVWPQNYFPNPYHHQPRYPRPQFMHHNRPPNHRAMRTYEDLDAPAAE